MSLEDIIREKISRLNSVPAKFVSRIQIVEKDFYQKVLLLIENFEREGAVFLLNKKNLTLLAEIEQSLRTALLNTDIVNMTREYIREFDVQAGLNNKYFSAAFKDFTPSEILTQLITRKKEIAIDLLLNNGVHNAFLKPVADQLELAITSKATFSETLEAVQQIAVTSKDADSRLLSYSKQVTYDAFAISDRAYTKAVSDDLGLMWFKYHGGRLDTTRPFCDERLGKHFHRKEIEKWGEGEATQGMKWPKDGTWAGERTGTDKSTIFSVAGGYRCQHSILPTSIFAVSKEDFQRNVKNGNHKPTEVELRKFA